MKNQVPYLKGNDLVTKKSLSPKCIAIFMFLFGWLLLTNSALVFSQSVDVETAHQVAHTWLMQRAEKKDIYLIQPAHPVQNDQGVLAYVFALKPAGYVVVSADMRLVPVLAYSYHSEYQVESLNENPLEELIIADLSNRLVNLTRTAVDTSQPYIQQWEQLLMGVNQTRFFEQWPPVGTTSSGGWVESNYNQTSPYNIFCPMDLVANQRSLAGCPSVAMAMIVDYTNTLNGTQLDETDAYYHNYGGNRYWIDADHVAFDFLSFPEINQYFESITEKYNNNEQINAEEKAALIFGCGIAARQVYGSGGSGTFGVDQAFEAYQRFGYIDSRLVDDTDTSFYTQMKHNIMQAMPVHLALLQSGASGGHNVVADGYNTDDYYHINFGWGGSYNGWYHVPDDLPYSLTILEGAVMDIGARQVGLNDLKQRTTERINISPNPCTSFTQLTFELKDSGFVAIELYSLNGMFMEQVFQGNLLSGNNKLDMNEIPEQGCYLIVIRTDHELITQKLVVL